MPQVTARYLRYAAVVTAWWLAYGLLSATRYRQMLVDGGVDAGWGGVLRTELGSALLWIPFSLVALGLAERFPLGGRSARPGRAAALAVLAQLGGLALAVVGRAAAVVLLNGWIPWYEAVPPAGELLLTSLLNNLFMYLLLTGVAHAVHYARIHRLREAQLSRAQLHALRAQVRPHFLFNALNAVTALIRDDPATAERMVTGLGALLRRSLDSDGAVEVPLREELDLAESYLDIERARFADRLTVRWHVDPAALDARVPPLVLQPLAENAVRHGLWPRAAPGTVVVTARREHDELVLTVEDDGVGLPDRATARRGAGIGVANLTARLAQLYGARGRLALTPRAGGGTTATVVLPYRPAHAAAVVAP
jgi:two-component system, LytTR family, sensor kinase